MPRKPRADSAQFARETALAIANLPEPPLPLSDNAGRYWSDIIAAKHPDSWTEIDLHAACGLAEDLALVEKLRRMLQNSQVFGKDSRGKIIPHPALKQIDEIEQRIRATKRSLQVHSGATNGQSVHQATKNSTARSIGRMLNASESDLIPRLRG